MTGPFNSEQFAQIHDGLVSPNQDISTAEREVIDRHAAKVNKLTDDYHHAYDDYRRAEAGVVAAIREESRLRQAFEWRMNSDVYAPPTVDDLNEVKAAAAAVRAARKRLDESGETLGVAQVAMNTAKAAAYRARVVVRAEENRKVSDAILRDRGIAVG
ncbi:hypothetical protein [Pseudonocardia oroxyli]|nr:hypothetical protein [Pseudonocardia oroxyli]